ncbi:hypothetical protein D3C75_1253410 [compost metagenome]
MKKSSTDVLDKKTAGLKEAKQHTNAALDKQSAGLKEAQGKVNQTGQQLKQAQRDAKAVAKDPVKAAATAVLNQG